MEQIINFLEPIVVNINTYMSNYILIALLVGTGLFYSIKTHFVQIRCFGEGMKKVFGGIRLFGNKQGGGLSSFQALATAIAAQVGTGNIVGASSAILVGGPGAIFWMWVIAFFGMATIYAEAVLAQETKITDQNGEIHGGPVYYIKKAYKGAFGKFLAGFFAVAIILALGFIGAMVQSNSIAQTSGAAFGIEPWIIGLVLTVICAIIFIGGIQRIASVAEKIVPLMAVLYIILGFIILALNFKVIPETFMLIFKYAFQPHALLGGGLGAAIMAAVSQGAKRGLFSNEAGMGSTPHAHAQANVKKPHDQGVVAMIGVFIDTFIVLNITALVVISTLYAGDGPLSAKAFEGGSLIEGFKVFGSEISGANAMQLAMGNHFGEAVGNILIATCLMFFAFTTIIGWNFFAKINVQYLFKNNKVATSVFSVIAIAFIFLGSCINKVNLVWELADMFNNLMVIPNVLALIPLYSIVVNSSKSNKESPLK